MRLLLEITDKGALRESQVTFWLQDMTQAPGKRVVKAGRANVSDLGPILAEAVKRRATGQPHNGGNGGRRG